METELDDLICISPVDGRLYVMGGWGSGGSDAPFTLMQVYDVAADKWSEGTQLPEVVHHAGAAVVRADDVVRRSPHHLSRYAPGEAREPFVAGGARSHRRWIDLPAGAAGPSWIWPSRYWSCC